MKEKIVQFFRSAFSDFIPVWKWELPVAKKKQKHCYKSTVSVCRYLQYSLGIFTILLAACFERSREMLIYAFSRRALPSFAMDACVYISLWYFLGMKRSPVNYISLIILKIFTILDEKFRVGHVDIQAKSLGSSDQNGDWIAITGSPKMSTESNLRQNIAVILAALVSFWIIDKYCRIDFDKYRETVLISQTVASSWASILLVSTFAFDAFPEMKMFHRRSCEVWILFSTVTLIFVLAFLLKRLLHSIGGKLQADFYTRIGNEGFLFVIIFANTLRLIPLFHKGMHMNEVFANKLYIICSTIFPSSLINGWDSLCNIFG